MAGKHSSKRKGNSQGQLKTQSNLPNIDEQTIQISSSAAVAAHRNELSEHYGSMRASAKRKKRACITALAVAFILVAIAAAVYAYVYTVNSQLRQGLDENLKTALADMTEEDTANTEPFYMLLMGVDKNEERAESESSFRSDSIILTRVDPLNKSVTLISIHRDTQVELGSYGVQKINAAYSLGGSSYMVQTISEFAGVPITHYAEVDFESFCSIVDDVGGITVNVPVDVIDLEHSGANIKAGVQELNGEQALQLCRARHAYDN